MWAAVLLIVGWITTAYDYIEHFIVAALVAAWHVLVIYLKIFGGFAKGMWSDVIKPLGVWLDKAYTRLKALYDKVIGPYHAWIKRIVDVTRRIYDTFFVPILTTIDAIEGILKVLELLHVDFAKQLDEELQKLELKITLPIQTVIQTINAIDNRIEAYILTVDHLFKSVTLLNSIKRDIDQIRAVNWAAFTDGLPRFTDTKKQTGLTRADAQASSFRAAFDKADDRIFLGDENGYVTFRDRFLAG